MSIEAMKQARSALIALHAEGVRVGWHVHPKWESKMRDAANAIESLHIAIQQAEAKTDEPVFFVSPAQARAVNGKNRCHYTPSDNSGRYLPVRATPAGLFTQPVYTHPAPGVPGALKDHQISALVNKVRDIARMFHDHQSLRERIAIELVPALKASQDVQSNAERWIYAIADGGNQSMNFMDIFGDWDGDGSFVEVFDAARLADKQKGSAA